MAPLLPANGEQIRAMLRIFLLELALRKLAYEVTHAPERIRIPSHADCGTSGGAMNYRAPGSTYRMQFHQGFRFVDGRDLVPYLSDLGITDLYSSPRYKARRGSSHGYDITSPSRVNSELGTEEDFDELADKLRHYGMGLLLDTVPNHMAASYENPWWLDVLENGQASAYASYFDIDWHPATTKAAALQENRVLLPVLGSTYGDVLARGQLSLKIEDTGISVRYFERRMPLDPKTYTMILKRCLEQNPRLTEIPALVADLERLPHRDEAGAERIQERRRQKDRIKERLWRTYQENGDVKRAVDDACITSPDRWTNWTACWASRLSGWHIGRSATKRSITGDSSISTTWWACASNRARFSKTANRRPSNWCATESDRPARGPYRRAVGARVLPAAHAIGGPTELYMVVEKILGREERLPRCVAGGGTTGYDFLNAVNGIFVHPEGLERLEEIYARRTGNDLPFAELCYRCSKQVMQTLFKGDVNAWCIASEYWPRATARRAISAWPN